MTCASFHILDPCRIPTNIGKPEEQKPKKVRTREINTATKVALVFLIIFLVQQWELTLNLQPHRNSTHKYR